MPSLGLRDIPLDNRDDEALNIGTYADALVDFILQCETPLTIALQGDWGSGKTSLMNLIKKHVENDKFVHTIWFNTWQYSQFDMQGDLSTSLLSHFVDELNVGEESKMAKNAITLAKRGGGVLLKQAASFFGGDTAKDVVENVLERLSADELDSSKQISKLKKEIENVVASKINKIGGDEKARIVVFIDDLDRLLPERAVEMLEVFKLFLDVPGCVYVLACDYQVISQGLKKKFGLGSEELKGKSFFDKIIQLPFSMPLGQYDVIKYIKKLLDRIEVECDDNDIRLYADMINYSVGFNPRGIKRIFNSLLLLNLVAKRKQLFESNTDIATKSEKQRIIFVLLCMQTAYEVVYEYLQKKCDEVLTSEFIEGLKDEEKLVNNDKYKELRDVIIKEKSGIDLRQLSQFMEILFNAIQLKSDKQDNVLSDSELRILREILVFSALTSNKGQQAPQSNFTADRFMNRDMAKKLVDELWKDNKETFIKNNYGKFTTYQQRNIDEVQIYFAPHKQMTVIFIFDKNCIRAALGGGNRKNNDFTLEWIKEKKVEESFPELKYLKNEWSAVYLWEYKANTDMSRDDMESLFKDKTIQTINKLISLLDKQ